MKSILPVLLCLLCFLSVPDLQSLPLKSTYTSVSLRCVNCQQLTLDNNQNRNELRYVRQQHVGDHDTITKYLDLLNE